MSSYLDLNKKNIKKSVVSKLNLMGYKVNEDTKNNIIQNIIKSIQKDHRLMIDGYIGVQTMPILGYTNNEIRKLLKLPKYRGNSSYEFPLWLLFN